MRLDRSTEVRVEEQERWTVKEKGDDMNTYETRVARAQERHDAILASRKYQDWYNGRNKPIPRTREERDKLWRVVAVAMDVLEVYGKNVRMVERNIAVRTYASIDHLLDYDERGRGVIGKERFTGEAKLDLDIVERHFRDACAARRLHGFRYRVYLAGFCRHQTFVPDLNDPNRGEYVSDDYRSAARPGSSWLYSMGGEIAIAIADRSKWEYRNWTCNSDDSFEGVRTKYKEM